MFVTRLNRFLYFEDIIEKYGGPPEIWAQLRPGLPVWTRHNGRPVYLESQVDEYLHLYCQRLQATRPAAPTTPTSPYLTVQEAAEYCRLAVGTIHNRSSEIRRKPNTKKLLFRREDLDAWLESRRRKR